VESLDVDRNVDRIVIAAASCRGLKAAVGIIPNVGERTLPKLSATSRCARSGEMPGSQVVMPIELIDTRPSEGQGKALLSEPDRLRRRELGRRAVDGGWSVRALETEIARSRESRQDRLIPTRTMRKPPSDCRTRSARRPGAPHVLDTTGPDTK
jgi:hypothetical protein